MSNFTLSKNSSASWFGSSYWVPGTTDGFSLTATNTSGSSAILRAVEMGVTACNSGGKEFSVDVGGSYVKRGPANGAGCSLYAQFTYGGTTYISNTVSIPSVDHNNVGTHSNGDGTYYGGQDHDDPYNFAFYPYHAEDYRSTGKTPVFTFANSPSIPSGSSITIYFYVPENGWTTTSFSGSPYLQISSRAPIDEPVIYTVTYDANGGTNPPSPAYVVAGDSTPQPSNPRGQSFSVSWNVHGGSYVTTPTPRYKSLKGWYTASSGGTKIVFPYTPSSSVILYAQWNDPIVGLLPTTSKTGYNFDGWYTAASGGTQIAVGTKVTSNVTYHAQWSPITYTVKYYLDGTLQNSLTQSSCKYGTTYSYPTLPSKTGYVVSGWYANSNGTGTVYSGTFSNLTLIDGTTVKRYAVSSPISYTVKYYLDGVEQSSLAQTCVYDTSYTYPNLPSKPGYLVDGWYVDSVLTTPKYSPGTSFSNLSNSAGVTIRRYAKSTPNTFTVSYDANGGTGAPSAQTKTGGVDLTLSSVKPTKSFQLTYDTRGGTLPSGTTNPATKSCTFSSWKATDGTTYAPGGTYTKDEGTTLTAQWTNPTLGTLPTPTRSGYRFDGWYTEATGGTQVTASTTMSGNMIIYAHWVQQVTLTYNTNGGSGSVASETKDIGSEFTIKNYTGTKSAVVTYNANGGNFSGSTTTTESANMVFQGWADSSSATTAQYVYNHSTKGTVVLSADKIIYGVWSAGSVTSHPSPTPKTVTLTYNPNGGTIPTVANRTKQVNLTLSGWATTQARANAGTVDYGTSAAIPTGITVYAVWTSGAVGALPTISIFASRREYRLDTDTPWTTTQNGSTAVTSSTTISADTTIYAKWEYSVIVNGNGGYIYTSSGEGAATLTVWKKHGVNYTTPSNIVYDEGDPYASQSRTFIGYATSASGSKSYDPGFIYSSNEPKILYAVFQVKQYTVKFTDGYSTPEVVLKTETVNHGGNATPPEAPTRSRYTFSGWIGTYTNVMIDTTVKAAWGFCPVWIRTSSGWVKYEPKENSTS